MIIASYFTCQLQLNIVNGIIYNDLPTIAALIYTHNTKVN
jgi:hypothetical protein